MSPLPRAGLCLLLAAPPVWAQVELQKFVSDAPAWGEQLGWNVALDGDVLAIAEPGADLDGLPDRGAIFVYRWSSGQWTLEQEVVAPDAEPWDQLSSCALEGDTLVAGAPHDDVDGVEDVGSVHVFVRGPLGWSKTQTLFAPGGLADDRFGDRVALSGDLLVVGAPLADAPFEPNRGRVYIFRRTAGAFAYDGGLSASGSNALSGDAVAVDGEVVVFGAPHSSIDGRAFVCRKHSTSWQIDQTLNPLGGGGSWSYGDGIALRDGLLAVGGPGAFGQGVVGTYRLVGEDFAFITYLFASDGDSLDSFGRDVALSGGWLVVGAPRAEGGSPAAGAAYVRRWDAGSATWGAEVKLVGGPSDSFAGLGSSVAIDGPLVVAGAPTEKVVATIFEGSATVFSFMSPAWSYAGGSLPGTHGAPSLTATGTLQAATPVSLELRDARESAPAALVLGPSLLEAPFKGGTLVPMPSLTVLVGTNAIGELALSATWPAGIPSGATLWVQAWIQDPAAVAGWAATNALRATQP